jgi:Asp-tRNA(Asn)/Glu-tRNA(Gln) amidotransferase A subunit family amidase
MKKSGISTALILVFTFIFGAFFEKMIEPIITSDSIKEAANIMGLHFSEQEIDSLLPGVSELNKGFSKNREKDIDNGVSPAFVFDPRPSGFEAPTGASGLTPSMVKPFIIDKAKLPWYSILELAYLIKSKQISSVELTQYFISRIKKYNSSLFCVITVTEELALRQAKKADEEIAAGNYRGLLHGIPYGAKDLLATEGYKTTWGATPYKDQMINENATVIQKLNAAGAVLMAKTSMGALAWGDVWFGGTTKNPWDIESGSSGSSAGSASAVSAGLMPFAIGTETLGSIVSPSTVCGTTGLRPTFGRVSRHGAMALSWTLDKIGPISRTAEDCALVFSVIQGKDNKDLSVQEFPFNYNAALNIKSLKIGYLKSSFDRNYPFKKQDSLILALLKKEGINLIPVELPELPYLSPILSAESAAAFDELTRNNKDDLLVRQIKNAWPNKFRESRFIPAVEYIQANRKRKILMEEMKEKVFSTIDLYLNPSWGGTSLTITNYTGHPCIVIPNGFINGKPTSITITGNLYQEAQVIALAHFIQSRTEHHRQHPTFP